MADQNFMDLASKTASGITGTDYMMLVNNSEAYKALVNDVAEAILGKLTSKSFSGLETTAKNVIGALNELNSKTRGFFKNISIIERIPDGEDLCQYLYDNYTEKSSIRIVGVSSAITVSMGVPTTGGGFLIFYRSQTDNYGLVVYFSYTQTIYIKRLSNGWGNWKGIS